MGLRERGTDSFLVGWLLPHGSVEIPAILLAGQRVRSGGRADRMGAAFQPATAAKGDLRRSDRPDFRRGVPAGVGGPDRSFLSQYHSPVIPYDLKIGFGLVQ